MFQLNELQMAEVSSEVKFAVEELYEGYEQIAVYQTDESGTMHVIEAVSPVESLTQLQLWKNGELLHAMDYEEEEFSIEGFLEEANEFLLDK